jgi:hypothetical protein
MRQGSPFTRLNNPKCSKSQGGFLKGSNEGSETAKVCTEEHELHMRLTMVEECAQQHEFRRKPKPWKIDAAVISGRKMLLQEEIL